MRPKRTIITALLIFLLLMPSFALAKGDYEQGDGWEYQDGILKITESDGLINYIYHDEEQISDSPDPGGLHVVDQVIIGKSIKEDIVIEHYVAKAILSTITVEEGNPCYIVENGWIVNTATKTLFGAANVKQKKALSSIEDLPDFIEHIGMYAFDDYSNLEHITIPENVVTIEESSFNGCDRIKSIHLPRVVTSIGIAAFSGCTNLVQIDFGDQIDYIGPAAFLACIHLETPPFYKMKIETIYGNSFWGCDTFQTVEFPPTLRKVEDQAFSKSVLLNTLIFNSDQLTIENGAFGHCENIRKLIFTKGKPTSIGDSLFGEKEKTPDGKSFITRFYDPNGKIIPYPTLFYTAAYADEWAPNGETEWNGYPIEEISQDELNAILAEARGEPAPTSIATAASAATAELTDSETQTEQANTADTPLVGVLVAGLIVLIVVAVVVVSVRVRRKDAKSPR